MCGCVSGVQEFIGGIMNQVGKSRLDELVERTYRITCSSWTPIPFTKQGFANAASMSGHSRKTPGVTPSAGAGYSLALNAIEGRALPLLGSRLSIRFHHMQRARIKLSLGLTSRALVAVEQNIQGWQEEPGQGPGQR